MYLYKIFFYWWWCFRTRLENRANDFNFSWNSAAFLSKTVYSLPTTSFCWGCGWRDFWISEFQVAVFPAGWWVSSVTPSVWLQWGEEMLSKLTVTTGLDFTLYKGLLHTRKKGGSFSSQENWIPFLSGFVFISNLGSQRQVPLAILRGG